MDSPVPAEPSPPPPANSDWTVRKVLEWTTAHLKKHGSDTPRLDAEILLAFARKCQRIQLYTAYDEPLSEAVRATMRDLVQRRANAEPVAYLVGHREFFSLDFRVTRDVLIPRPDTETLVLELMDAIRQRREATAPDERPTTVLDLCTGSGCVAIAAARQCQHAKWPVQVLATDASMAALEIARDNAARLGVTSEVEFASGDLFKAVPAGRTFDILVSNPPYIPSGEIDQLDPEVSRHEPRQALDGGSSGLEVIERLIAAAPQYANPGASLLLEFSPEQATVIHERLKDAGYRDIVIRKDLGGRARVIRATVQAVMSSPPCLPSPSAGGR